MMNSEIFDMDSVLNDHGNVLDDHGVDEHIVGERLVGERLVGERLVGDVRQVAGNGHYSSTSVNHVTQELWPQQTDRLSSLRWRLTTMLGFILLCTLLVISVIVATFVRNTEVNSWLDRQKEATDYTAQSVQNLVQQVSTTLNLINAFELSELEAESAILHNILRNNYALTEVAYFNARGLVVANATMDNLYLLTAGTSAAMSSGIATEATTPPTAHNGDTDSGTDSSTMVVNTNWFGTARRGDLYFDLVRPATGTSGHQQYLVFAMPAANQSVLAARIHISILYQVVSAIPFGSGGQSYVLNQDGDIIAHSNLRASDDYRNIADRVEFIEATSSRTPWYGSYLNFEEQRVMGVTRQVESVRWLVITEAPHREIFATTRRAYLVLGGGMLAFVILMMWASAEWMEGLILTPIERLRDGAERIGSGDLTHRIDAIHHDEIGQVALAFNHMAIELQGLYGGLEQKITERTERLEEQAQELARSNAELAQFAYIASHDLQEPLRMISNYLQLIDHRYRGQIDADADEFINYAVDGAMRMQQLIRDLLAYSRVGTRGQAFHRIDLRQIVEQVLDDLQVMVQDRNATITVNPLPQVLGDATQISQLFQNLLTNALKFCEQSQPAIDIRASYESGPQEWLFAVRDNGIGIDPEYFERIFLIFQRLHTRNEYPGTGIGLAICKKIIERHGGRIWVDSQAGEGTTIYFTIPNNPSRATYG